jgi:hypothetical protein
MSLNEAQLPDVQWRPNDIAREMLELPSFNNVSMKKRKIVWREIKRNIYLPSAKHLIHRKTRLSPTRLSMMSLEIGEVHQ